MWLVISDMRNLVNCTGALKHLKICTFRDFFCSGYIRIQGIIRLSVLQRSYVSWHWYMIQYIFKKTNSWFGKWHKKFDQFSFEHSKGWTFKVWWAPFVKTNKSFSQKNTEELSLMTLNSDPNFEENDTEENNRHSWRLNKSSKAFS